MLFVRKGLQGRRPIVIYALTVLSLILVNLESEVIIPSISSQIDGLKSDTQTRGRSSF